MLSQEERDNDNIRNDGRDVKQYNQSLHLLRPLIGETNFTYYTCDEDHGYRRVN